MSKEKTGVQTENGQVSDDKSTSNNMHSETTFEDQLLLSETLFQTEETTINYSSTKDIEVKIISTDKEEIKTKPKQDNSTLFDTGDLILNQNENDSMTSSHITTMRTDVETINDVSTLNYFSKPIELNSSLSIGISSFAKVFGKQFGKDYEDSSLHTEGHSTFLSKQENTSRDENIAGKNPLYFEHQTSTSRDFQGSPITSEIKYNIDPSTTDKVNDIDPKASKMDFHTDKNYYEYMKKVNNKNMTGLDEKNSQSPESNSKLSIPNFKDASTKVVITSPVAASPENTGMDYSYSYYEFEDNQEGPKDEGSFLITENSVIVNYESTIILPQKNGTSDTDKLNSQIDKFKNKNITIISQSNVTEKLLPRETFSFSQDYMEEENKAAKKVKSKN